MTNTDTQSTDLPKGWVWTTLGEIAESIRYGHTASAKDNPVGPKFLRITDIQNRRVNWDTVPYCECTEEQHQKYRLQPGDIVFARTGATTGKSFLIKNCPDTVFASYLIQLRFYDSITPQYFEYFFDSPIYWSQIMVEQQGSAQPGVNATILSKLYSPLPPLAEQHRIVAKIEELFSDLDHSVAALEAVQAQLKIYRQAVLKYAFEGKLTEQWRQQHTPPPVAELLAQIQAERGQNGKPAKPLPPLTEAELAELPSLPEGWVWVKIEDVGKVGTGATPLKNKKAYYENGNIPWVTSTALNDAYVRKANDFITDLALKETNVKIFPKHTLLVAMYGEGKTRGKCSELLIEATTNQAIAAIIQQGVEELVRPYLKHFLFKNYQDIRRKSSGGVQPNLNLDIIKNTIFPICSLEEQHAIIEEIEARLSVIDKLEETIETSLQQAEALRQSILKQAFAGKLVPQDPNDEPAAVLLERIRNQTP